MRKSPTKRIERYRITSGPRPSTRSDGANGAFQLRIGGVLLTVLASDGSDWAESGLPGAPWEHVSVSLPSRCPTWAEMDAVKRIFWRDDETVMQLHVPRDQHINEHDYCLHLWKPTNVAIPTPPVGAV